MLARHMKSLMDNQVPRIGLHPESASLQRLVSPILLQDVSNVSMVDEEEPRASHNPGRRGAMAE